MQGRALPAVLVQHPSRGPVKRGDVARRIAQGRPAVSFTPNRNSVRVQPRRPVPLTPAGVAAAHVVVPELARMPRLAAAIQGQPLRSWVPITRPRTGQPFSQLAERAIDPPTSTDEGTFESEALVGQAQVLLTAWGRSGGPIDPPNYGSEPSDLAADSTQPRFGRAVQSFQAAWNGAGKSPRLAEDGQLDLQTYAALVQTGGAALAPHATIAATPPAPPNEATSGGEWLLAVPILVLVAAYFSKGKA